MPKDDHATTPPLATPNIGEPAYPMVEEREPPHHAGKPDVELYIRTYNTLLRSSAEVGLSAIIQAHYNIESSLHPGARDQYPDMAGLIYGAHRLPGCIMEARHILLGQSEDVFQKHHIDLDHWRRARAPGRRRQWFHDGAETLACYIASPSDVDDLIPTLTAFQIEWNKFHALLNGDDETISLLASAPKSAGADEEQPSQRLRERLFISVGDWERLRAIWGDRLWLNLRLMQQARKNFTVRMLGGSYTGFARARQRWWEPIHAVLNEQGLTDRPIYFVSSNTHSLANLVSGYILRHANDLREHVLLSEDRELLPELSGLLEGRSQASLENFYYYAGRRYGAALDADHGAERRAAEDRERGIHVIPGRHALDVDAQVIELAKLHASDLDPRLQSPYLERLARSQAVIINIDYPLGLAAYHVFRQVAESINRLDGVYILGKAATLNGSIGDVMISDTIYDEHSQNTYWFTNCFTAADITPYLRFGSVLDNQKAVAVKGTFLQNKGYLDFYYRENYTVVEMEAGPYLNAFYELLYPTRHPIDSNVSFIRVPIDIGIVHYASDTPYTRARNLGAQSLSYRGLDSTYAATIAILRRILWREGCWEPSAAPPKPQEIMTEG